MTSTDVAARHAPVSPHTPTLASLGRSEALRLRSRRFVRWTLLAVLALMVGITLIIVFNAQAMPSQSDVAGNVLGIGVAVATLGFVFGATAAGAEWSNKTMPALLFWEPRRVRVYLTKVVVLIVFMLAVFVVAAVIWTLLYQLVIAFNSSTVPGSVDTGEVLVDIVRSVILVVTASATGFGIASLVRNTGAALGVAFVYFAVAETLLRVLIASSVPWLLTTNIGALATSGGLDIGDGDHPHVIGNTRGAVVLVVYAVVLCGAGLELFRRRDVT